MSDFVIMMDSQKYLKVTQNRVLYVGENYAEIMRFIVPKTYGDYDLTDWTATLQYVDPEGNARIDILVADEEIYKENYIRYTLPVTSSLTHNAGTCKLQLVLTHVDSELLVQYVISSSELNISIQPHSDYYKFSDESLSKIEKLIGELDAKMGYIEEAETKLATKVPTDLEYDSEGTLHLEVGTELIGTGKNVGTVDVSDDEDSDNSDGVINLNQIYMEVDL